jgi:hypothetical protein
MVPIASWSINRWPLCLARQMNMLPRVITIYLPIIINGTGRLDVKILLGSAQPGLGYFTQTIFDTSFFRKMDDVQIK